jgi:hypothetical protein
VNWYEGWSMILVGFASGAALGLFFHHENFLGGYGSFRRRMLRLGHIACAALGMLNLIVALSPQTSPLLVAGKSIWEATTGHVFFEWLHFGRLGTPIAVSHLGGVIGGAAMWMQQSWKEARHERTQTLVTNSDYCR